MRSSKVTFGSTWLKTRQCQVSNHARVRELRWFRSGDRLPFSPHSSPCRSCRSTTSTTTSALHHPRSPSTIRWLSTQKCGYLHSVYQKMVETEGLHEDPIQLHALKSLDRLRSELQTTPPPPPVTADALQKPTSSSSSSFSSSFGSWFGGGSSTSKSSLSLPKSLGLSFGGNGPKGVYLHGGVGCGKTVLMDLFYDSITEDTMPEWAKEKQHVHFHKFLLTVHQQMHQARQQQQGEHVADAILPWVIQDTLKHGRLICFDEFQVTDVADAMIMKRLFTGLWDHGCIMVATSNRPPRDLYLGGLQRDRFISFIDLLEEKCEVVSLRESDMDYRMVQGREKHTNQVYFVGKEERKAFNALFFDFAGGKSLRSISLEIQGGTRKVNIPQASLNLGICRFTFEDLCQKALGAADYLMIGQNFHTVFVENIPKLSLPQINWVRRFITFVDAMYESKVTLVLQAATPPDGIFQVDPKDAADDEVFAFDRTRSRLEEMMSANYLQTRWKGEKEKRDIVTNVKLEPSLSDDAAWSA